MYSISFVAVVKSPGIVLNPSGVSYKDVVTGELVSVKTAEGVETGEGIISEILTGVRTIVGILTTGLVGDTSKIKWDKLKMAGSAFTTAFPFSLPWDVVRWLLRLVRQIQ